MRRTLKFPEDASLGFLHTRQGGYPYSFHGRYKKEGGLLDGIDNPGWELHGEARGEQSVTGDCVILEVLADPAKDLSSLSKLKPDDLDALWLGNTWVDDAQVQHIRHLTGLRWLNIENNFNITDAGIVHVAGLQSLVHLGIHWTRVTDAGLRQLSELQFLDVWGCPITSGAIVEYRSRFPNCKVRVE